MSENSKYKNLAQLLYLRTVDRKIDWDMHGSERVRTEINSRKVDLYAGRDENDEPVEIVKIANPNGTTVDEFTDDLFWGEVPSPPVKFDSYFKMMNATRQLALRQAVGADEAIDDILGWLDEDLPF